MLWNWREVERVERCIGRWELLRGEKRMWNRYRSRWCRARPADADTITTMDTADTRLLVLVLCCLRILQWPVSCQNRSNDTFAPTVLTCLRTVAARQRQSPYPLVPLREAVSLILQNTPVAPVQTLPVEETLLGSVLADDVTSEQAIPGRPSTNVDGYAVRCKSRDEDTSRPYAEADL